MDSQKFDALAKTLASVLSRRKVLKGAAATAAGGALAAAAAGRADAAPRTCATCQCGVGRPCNVKETTCAELGRQFPTPEDACRDVCTRHGFKFCGAGTQVHCPRGCPA